MQYRELFWRTAFDLRMLGSSLLSARGGIWPKVVLLLGAVCTVAPFDLVPGRIPVIGYLGEFTSGVISMVAAFRLLPQAYRDEYRSSLAGGDALPAWMPVHSGAGHGSATPRWLQVDARQVQLSALRLVILQSVALLVARPLLRVVIGRWPVAADVTAFRASFTYFEPNPPLLRALASVPAAGTSSRARC